MNTSLKNLSDEDLIYIYRTKKKPEAITIIYNRYHHLIYGICLKYLKEPDYAKDSMMNIFEKLLDDVFKHDIKIFKFWIHRVTQNYCLMEIRKKKSTSPFLIELKESIMESEHHSHPTNDIEESLQIMEYHLESLPEEQKSCIKLFYLEKKSYVEIQAISGYTFGQVKSFIQNGKRNLKLKITESLSHD